MAQCHDKELTRTIATESNSIAVIVETSTRQHALTVEGLLDHRFGQIVSLAKAFRGDEWHTLGIPRGQLETYNQPPERR